ncbi:glycosyltransferase family 4 protein [Gammaproteobacteria bacterium]|nr:glycosyltransferase family 4 protein [Gammaproteobacteria bacterium]
MKVFIVNPGAVDDYAYELASALSKFGVKVRLFGGTNYSGKEVNFKNFNYYNYFFDVNSIKLKPLKKFLKLLLYIYLQFHILLLLLKERPDIIHLQWAKMPILDRVFIRIFNFFVPVVFTLHNTTPNHGDDSLTNDLIQFGFRSFLQKTSSIILHTDYSKEIFCLEYPDFLNKVSLVPHGLLTFPTSDKIKKFQFSFSSDLVLLFFGNIEKYKGLDVLIKAMPYLKNESVELLIAGRPNIPIEPFIKLSEDLNISDLITWYPSFIDEDDVSEIFDNGDLVILPHLHIDQSGVLMSAINFEKPIIASDTGGFSEIIENDKHGYLFKPGDHEDLASQLLKVINNDTVKYMSQEVSALRKNWKTWQEIAEVTLDIYTDVICHRYGKES